MVSDDDTASGTDAPPPRVQAGTAATTAAPSSTESPTSCAPDTDASDAADSPSEPVVDQLDASQDVVGKLIESQVTGLVEALREGVQNGTDKPTASYVGVIVRQQEAVIVDDGQPLDFTRERDRSKFLSLGTSVKDSRNGHVIGEHGLGSATLMAMGALRVWSGSHVLHVD